ncbi:MAG: hypothetical protein ABIR15_05275 [Chitinophagaceae bacterium]
MLKDLKTVIEKITLKKIFNKYPEAILYQSMITFSHNGAKASMNLDLLPPELTKKIEEMFE